MADFRSLVIIAGLVSQIQDGDRIIAPSGVISSGANLALVAAQGFNADLTAEKEASETNGSTASVTGGEGGDSAGVAAGGTGGFATITGGVGGAGDATFAAGAGGEAQLLGASGGVDNGGGGGAGGNARVDAGIGTGAAANGAVNIGNVNAGSVGIGRSGIRTTVTGLSTFTLDDNTADAFIVEDAAGNDFINLDLTTGSEVLLFGNTTQPPAVRALIADNNTAAFIVQEAVGSNAYILVDTSTGSERIEFGNTTDDPTYSFRGLGEFQVEGAIVSQGTTAATGFHRFSESADPATVADTGAVYVKDDAGDTEFFYIDDSGNVVQITKDGQVNAQFSYAATADEALNLADLVAHDDSNANGNTQKADASSGAGVNVNAAGFATAAAAAAGSVQVQNAGEITVPDSQWDGTVPTATDIGSEVFMATTAGQVTLTAPSGLGESSKIVGYVSFADGGADTTRVSIQLQRNVSL